MVRCGNGQYKIKPPKNYSSNRNIEFPDFVIEKIKDIEGSIANMTPAALSDAFQRLVTKLDMPHFRFHDLRHYAVSSLHAINVPDKYIMARGGWSTNHTMNNVYNHILKKEKDKNEEKIIDHFNSVFASKNT
jgi:integrase